ncbi:MAG TPA: hypothetical protein DEP47_00715 [Chloroflexi bacterium]|jgi:hypothetical protein|nr:hypothetical protein [Chloroflexota bacterium]
MSQPPFLLGRHNLRWNTILIVWSILFLIAVLTDPVGAHTAGKMQLSAAPAGPYKMTVWTSPEPATLDELHIALAVVLAEDASPVLDAEVLVQLIPADGSLVLEEPATTEDSENKFLYEAIFEPATPGLYQVDIQVSGTDGATGNTSFDLEIVDDSGLNLLYLIPVGLGLAAVFLLFFALRGRGASERLESQ